MLYVWQILDFSGPAVFICLFSLYFLNAKLNSIRHWFESKQNEEEINIQYTGMYLMQTTMNYSLCIFYISQMYFRVNGSPWWRCSPDLALEVWGLITEINLVTKHMDSGFHFKLLRKCIYKLIHKISNINSDLTVYVPFHRCLTYVNSQLVKKQ